MTIMVLLDYSQVFNTIDHDLFLAVLKYFGMCAQVMKFFKTYLINTNRWLLLSIALKLMNAVPKGSILGPFLFIIYNTLLVKYLPDDAQVSLTFSFSEINENLRKPEI